jgi:hypothetical protein
MTVQHTLNYIQREMKVHDQERDYINPHDRDELIDLLTIQAIREAKDTLNPSELGKYVKGLLDATL